MAGGIPKLLFKDPATDEIMEVAFYPDSSKRDELIGFLNSMGLKMSHLYYSEWVAKRQLQLDNTKIHDGLYCNAGEDYIEECDLRDTIIIDGEPMVLMEKYFGPIVIMRMAAMLCGSVFSVKCLPTIKRFMVHEEWYKRDSNYFTLEKIPESRTASSIETYSYFKSFLDLVQISITRYTGNPNEWTEQMNNNYAYMKKIDR